MPVAELAKLAALENIRNASKTKLNEYFRGAASMPGDTAEQLWALMKEIVDYCDSSPTPTPVALTDAVQIKTILDQRREAKQFFAEVAERIVTEG